MVTLAYPDGTGRDALKVLEGLAHRYRAELVPLAAIEEAASRHGSPLPEVAPRRDEAPEGDADSLAGGAFTVTPQAPAPDMTSDDFSRSDARRGVKRSHVGLLIAVVLIALITAVIVLDHRSTPCNLQIIRVPGSGGHIEQCVSDGHPTR